MNIGSPRGDLTCNSKNRMLTCATNQYTPVADNACSCPLSPPSLHPRLHFRAILLFTVLQTMDKAGNSSIVPDRSLAAEDALQEDSSEVA